MEYRFKVEKDKNGQSQCYNCGAIEWHSLMYRDTKYNEMVCDKCRELIVQKRPGAAKVWPIPSFVPKHRQENSAGDMGTSYYDLRPMLGEEIIELREKVLEDDRIKYPKYYRTKNNRRIDVQPDKYYMASIVYEDISELTALYIEEIIYSMED